MARSRAADHPLIDKIWRELDNPSVARVAEEFQFRTGRTAPNRNIIKTLQPEYLKPLPGKGRNRKYDHDLLTELWWTLVTPTSTSVTTAYNRIHPDKPINKMYTLRFRPDDVPPASKSIQVRNLGATTPRPAWYGTAQGEQVRGTWTWRRPQPDEATGPTTDPVEPTPPAEPSPDPLLTELDVLRQVVLLLGTLPAEQRRSVLDWLTRHHP
jgi:hypothetical protein